MPDDDRNRRKPEGLVPKPRRGSVIQPLRDKDRKFSARELTTQHEKSRDAQKRRQNGQTQRADGGDRRDRKRSIGQGDVVEEAGIVGLKVTELDQYRPHAGERHIVDRGLGETEFEFESLPGIGLRDIREDPLFIDIDNLTPFAGAIK